MWTLSCGMWDLVPQPRVEPGPACIGSTESQPLDYQESLCIVHFDLPSLWKHSPFGESFHRLLLWAQSLRWGGSLYKILGEILWKEQVIEGSFEIYPGQLIRFLKRALWMNHWLFEIKSCRKKRQWKIMKLS